METGTQPLPHWDPAHFLLDGCMDSEEQVTNISRGKNENLDWIRYPIEDWSREYLSNARI